MMDEIESRLLGDCEHRWNAAILEADCAPEQWRGNHEGTKLNPLTIMSVLYLSKSVIFAMIASSHQYGGSQENLSQV